MLLRQRQFGRGSHGGETPRLAGDRSRGPLTASANAEPVKGRRPGSQAGMPRRHALAGASGWHGRRLHRSRLGLGGGFTLLEWLVCLVIIGILLSLATSVYRGAAETSVLAQARNAVVTYAQVAREYAVANHIETMLVVNPYNGRFEVWYSNPPPDGGRWDPLPTTPAGTADPNNIDSYAFAPILDTGARLPLLPTGEPAAAVNPIDYADPVSRPVDGLVDGPLMDNLTWAAFCFDESGQLVVRTRRIATRSFTLRSGALRPVAERNRLRDETPDLTVYPLVNEMDTPITSARGFVISDRNKVKAAMVTWPPTSQELVNSWLSKTQTGEDYYMFARTVVLNRFSGQQLTSGAP